MQPLLDRSIRLRLLRPWFAQLFAYRLDIRYEITARPDAPERRHDVAANSRGFLACICAGVTSDGHFHIERAGTTLTDSRLNLESGFIRLLLVVIDKDLAKRPLTKSTFEKTVQIAAEEAMSHRPEISVRILGVDLQDLASAPAPAR